MKQMKTKTRSPRGFTLLEVLIAVLIVGIIATVALPMLGSYTEKAREAQAQASAIMLQQAMQRYDTEHTLAPIGWVFDPAIQSMAPYGDLFTPEGILAQLGLPTDRYGTALGYEVTAEHGPCTYGPYVTGNAGAASIILGCNCDLWRPTYDTHFSQEAIKAPWQALSHAMNGQELTWNILISHPGGYKSKSAKYNKGLWEKAPATSPKPNPEEVLAELGPGVAVQFIAMTPAGGFIPAGFPRRHSVYIAAAPGHGSRENVIPDSGVLRAAAQIYETPGTVPGVPKPPAVPGFAGVRGGDQKGVEVMTIDLPEGQK